MSGGDKRVMDLHRDETGRGLLVGPNCPDCGRRDTVVFVCTACPTRWDVTGRYVWSWQGKGHFFEADDPEWGNSSVDHALTHGGVSGNACIVPESMRPRFAWDRVLGAEQDGGAASS